MKVSEVVKFLEDVAQTDGDLEVKVHVNNQARKITGFWIRGEEDEVRFVLASTGEK